jgi:diguanylate cyclase (GGDEF)-like protein
MVQRTLNIKLYRPKLGVGTKTLIALSASFWLPVLVLIGVLFVLLNSHFHQEATAQIRFGLKGAKTIYQERSVVLQQLMTELANNPEVKTSFAERDGARLHSALQEFGKGIEYISMLTAVDGDQRLIARRGAHQGEMAHLGDMLAPALNTGEVMTSPRLVSKKSLMLEDPELANMVWDVGLVQFVVVPVKHQGYIQGALVAGMLLTSDTSLADRVLNQMGIDFVVFGGKPTEGITLHSASSQPRSLWALGKSMPPKVSEAIALGNAFYGPIEVNGAEVMVAFEPLRDSLNRTVGAIGVSAGAEGQSALVFVVLGKGLIVAALLGLVISLIVTFFIRNDISQPMNALVEGMERFGNGELDISVDIQTGDQFEKLGSGFNHMAEGVFKREERLMKHNAVSKLLMSTLNLTELLDQTLRLVVEVSGSQVGVIYLWDQTGERLLCHARYGTQHDLAPLKLGEGYPGRAAQDKKILIEPFVAEMHEATIDSGFSKGAPNEVAYIPLVYKDRLLGVMVLGSISSYAEDEIQLFGYLADQISIALDNAIMHHHIQELSITDGLTGLYNRRYINERMEALWARAVRHSEPMTVILADIDNFKSVNDTYGHDRGDEVIRRISEIYIAGSRQEDLVARYGGEEFLVVLANTTSADAVVLAERIGQMAREAEYEWADRNITLSIGIATYPEVTASGYVDLVKFADQAMYKAKVSGKDQVVVYDASVESVLQ